MLQKRFTDTPISHPENPRRVPPTDSVLRWTIPAPGGSHPLLPAQRSFSRGTSEEPDTGSPLYPSTTRLVEGEIPHRGIVSEDHDRPIWRNSILPHGPLLRGWDVAPAGCLRWEIGNITVVSKRSSESVTVFIWYRNSDRQFHS